tara:strand:+ start:7441 stop:8190 length:750 start_codon:yes stop_codon:yes gene_type:complete
MLKDIYRITIKMRVDILVIMAHPDDAELCCSGTILSSINKGLSVGIVDLTKGELGTRGNENIRLSEAQDSAKILNIKFRDNLGFRDGFINSDENNIIEIIKKIRLYTPGLIITNSLKDRHPDHENTAKLVKKSCFLSGLVKYKTQYENSYQEPHRPKIILHSIQNDYVEPDIIIDVSDCFIKKMESIKCFKSQFYDPKSNEPDSFISSQEFLEFIHSRSIEMGHKIGVHHGEGFVTGHPIKINNISSLI